jgi:hypothetical protein
MLEQEVEPGAVRDLRFRLGQVVAVFAFLTTRAQDFVVPPACFGETLPHVVAAGVVVA